MRPYSGAMQSVYSHLFHSVLHRFEEEIYPVVHRVFKFVVTRCRTDHTQAKQMLDWMPNGSSSQIFIIQNEQEGYCVAAGIMSPFQTPHRYT
jgi:hypothetical protein